MSVSIVIPIYNEQDNVPLLYDALMQALPGLGRPYEVIFVDDGSADDSLARLEVLARRDPHVKLVELRRNFGQSAAMDAGFRHATGEVIVTMDGDLQNDPQDIPRLLAKLDEGYDLVHGWRKNRQDKLVSRKIPSKIANWLISTVTKFPVHDLGCTLKAIRREIVQDLRLYGEMHRFIPILAHWHGARCVEVVTRHHARQHGVSKYGIDRTFRVILDLMTVKYMIQYLISPMKLFGGAGLLCGLGGVLCGLTSISMKLLAGADITGNPLLYLSLFGVTIGIQFLFLGMLGEVAARIYYESQDKRQYAERRLVNFDKDRERPSRAA